MKFDNLTFSIDEESYCWSMEGQISDREDWTQAVPGKEIEVQIDTDVYSFIIDSRERTEVFGTSSYSITARSKTSLYGIGSNIIYKTWGNTTAHTVILELIPNAVITIPDWNFPDGLLSIDGETSISIVTSIATAAGGILYSDSEGILHIVPKYSIPPSDYNINSVDHVLSDMDQILELNETKELLPGYNQVQVSNEPDSGDSSVSISEYSRNLFDLTAILKISIFPFVSSINLLTSQEEIIISDSVLVEEEINEIIEIVDGVGSVNSPIFSLISNTYLGTDLDKISFTGTIVISKINGTSLVELVYITKYHFVKIKSDSIKKIQLYTEGE